MRCAVGQINILSETNDIVQLTSLRHPPLLNLGEAMTMVSPARLVCGICNMDQGGTSFGHQLSQ